MCYRLRRVVDDNIQYEYPNSSCNEISCNCGPSCTKPIILGAGMCQNPVIARSKATKQSRSLQLQLVSKPSFCLYKGRFPPKQFSFSARPLDCFGKSTLAMTGFAQLCLLPQTIGCLFVRLSVLQWVTKALQPLFYQDRSVFGLLW